MTSAIQSLNDGNFNFNQAIYEPFSSSDSLMVRLSLQVKIFAIRKVEAKAVCLNYLRTPEECNIRYLN